MAAILISGSNTVVVEVQFGCPTVQIEDNGGGGFRSLLSIGTNVTKSLRQQEYASRLD